MDAVDRLCEDLPPNDVLFDPWAGVPASGREASYYGAESYEVTDGGYCMKLRVPGAEEVKVQLHDLDLDLRIGNVLRRVPLPNTLRGVQITETKVEDGVLRVDFHTV